jgi:hypothetical protein
MKIYTITKIIKLNGNKETEVEYTQYVNPSIDNIKYKIFLNEPFEDDIKDGIYVYEQMECRIKLI